MGLLGQVRSGVVAAPVKTLVFGSEGVGKSTFAAAAAGALLMPVEDGANHLSVAKLPVPTSFASVLAALDELASAEHAFKTLAVDTVDALEPLIWAAVIEEARNPKIKSIEDFGYGKGYVAALDRWRVFLARLEKLRSARGMNITLVAHSQIKKFQNPEGEDFDRYELKLAGKGAAGLVKEWADNVLFAAYEVVSATDENKRTRGVSTGRRIARTVHSASYDAKNRAGLPDPMELDWQVYRAAMLAYLQTHKQQEVTS